MNKKIVHIVIYILCTFLVIFYSAILISASNPKVYLEYKAYYIDRALEYWVSYGSFDYILGTKEDFDGEIVHTRLGKIEKKGVRERGESKEIDEEASVYYRILNREGPIKLVMKLNTGSIEKMKGEIYANNILLGKFNGDKSEIELSIPEIVFKKNDDLVIRFHITSCVRLSDLLNSANDKTLGSYVSSLLLTEDGI